MAVVITKNNSFTNVDAGVYKAVVTAVSEESGQHGKYYRWSFKVKEPIVDGEESEEEFIITGNTPMKLFDGSKLDDWCVAMGLDSSDGENLDLEDGIGSSVMITVEVKTKDSKTFSNVKDVNKIRKKKARKPEPVEEEEEEEDTPPPKKKKKAVEEAPAKKKKPAPKPEPEDDDLDEDLDDSDLDDDDLDDLANLEDDD